MPGPLDGIRILDMTTVLMGPYATQILGDWGADVIKIESLAGDVSRNIGPVRNEKMGSIHLHLNRNKRSIVLDTKSEGGKQALHRLARTADVFVTNVRPKSLERMGIGREALAAENPGLIFVSIMGFGEGGRYRGRPAYDDLIQGAVGIPWLSRQASGQGPRYAPLALADRVVGLHAVGAILAAITARSRTGRGQSVEVPMFETMTQFVMGEHLQGRTFVPEEGPPGYPRLLDRERRPYETRDGYVCAMIYSDANWRDFLTEIGKWDEMKSDPRLANIGARTRHTSELYAIVAEAMKDRTTAEWMELFDRLDIPATLMHSPQSLMQDPHLQDVGFFHEEEHPTEGRMVSMAVPNTWSDTVPDAARPAPRLGQHTIELLEEAGYSPEEIKALMTSGAVCGPTLP